MHNRYMPNAVMILPVVVPILFWGWYHYYKDRHLPEPVGHLVLTFVLGIGAAAVSKGLYAIGPIEEFAKMLPFIIVVLRFPEFDEPLDGIIYASFIALGYAAVENVLYLEYLTPIEAAARGFAGPVIHMLFASIWGFTIGCAHLRGGSLLGGIMRGFLLAATLHGLYDFIVMQSAFNALPIAAGFIVMIWIWRLRLMQAMHQRALRSRNIEQKQD
jgi:RsiW-degrading membrane proteinase PrsW (M82 family)